MLACLPTSGIPLFYSVAELLAIVCNISLYGSAGCLLLDTWHHGLPVVAWADMTSRPGLGAAKSMVS